MQNVFCLLLQIYLILYPWWLIHRDDCSRVPMPSGFSRIWPRLSQRSEKGNEFRLIIHLDSFLQGLGSLTENFASLEVTYSLGFFLLLGSITLTSFFRGYNSSATASLDFCDLCLLNLVCSLEEKRKALVTRVGQILSG